MKFGHVKVGDTVQRNLCGKLMDMIVIHVDDELIYCDAADGRPLQGEPLVELWKFDRLTGAEEDEELGWGRKFGATGSRLELSQ